MVAYEKLGEKTFYIKGSPSTLIYHRDHISYVVDPGSGSKRVKTLRSFLRNINTKQTIVILTHCHSDHIAITERINPEKVYSSENDALFIRNRYLREYLTYGYQLRENSRYLLYNAPNITITNILSPPCTLDGLRIIPLPGHTLGQIGVLTEDNVLYVADAAFGNRVLDNVGIPYHLDAEYALNTLENLLNIIKDAEYVIFSHGPRTYRGNALDLIRKNIDRIKTIETLVIDLLGSAPKSDWEIAAKALVKLGVEPGTTLLMLSTVTIRSILINLESKGEVKPIVRDNGILWSKI